MKTLSLILALLLLFALFGCSYVPTAISDVETLKGWTFQYNESTDDYSVFFALLNPSGRYVSADVDIDIRIINDDGAEVYKATQSVGEDDFGHYTSQAAGEQYLANVRIPSSEIVPGTNASGTVYLTVYQGDSLRFDEVNCTAFYCLPVMDVQLVAESLPVEIDVKGFDGKIQSKIKVEEVTSIYDKAYTSQLKITFSGEKTFGGTASYDTIAYKIYDSQGYVTDSGNLFLSNLTAGDKFKDDTIVVYDVVPGETYTITFHEYSW